MSLTWRWTELRIADLGSGGTAGQLFEGRKQMRPEIFIREDLQNRVDAHNDLVTEPVRVVVTFRTLPASLIIKYFPEGFQQMYRRTETAGLKPDDASRRLKEIDKLFSSTEFPVLSIEDFNSTGLNGPINSCIPEKDKHSPLYHPTNALTCFFRRNGVSGKTDKKLGSAGLGRHVYYKASQISTKLVYSVPIDSSCEVDGRLESREALPIFFGQSLQRELAERVEGRQRRICSYHHLSGIADGEMPMPFGLNEGEESIVEAVRRDFRLIRADEPGCSTIIPFPLPGFTEESLTNSIVREFAMPILARNLHVRIGSITVDDKTVAKLSGDPVVNLHNAFLRQALSAQPISVVEVDQERLRRPFGDDLLPRAELVELAQQFNEGGLICVAAHVRFGSRGDQRGKLLLLAQKSDDGSKGRHIVARDGLVLSDHSDAGFTKQTNAISFVQTDRLGAILRASENPAHTKWLPGDIDVHACDCAEPLIKFITSAHTALARILTNMDTEDDLSIFSDLLPRGRTPPGQPLPPPFDVAIAVDGQTITVTASPSYDSEPGTLWRMALVYDSVQGSGRARKGYRPGTFNLQESNLQITGGRAVQRGDCHIDVAVKNSAKFQMILGPCGFADWADVRFHAALETGGKA